MAVLLNFRRYSTSLAPLSYMNEGYDCYTEFGYAKWQVIDVEVQKVLIAASQIKSELDCTHTHSLFHLWEP